MDFILPVVMLLIGIAVGGASIWLILKGKLQQADCSI
jgi:hypothetical protein